MRTYEKLRKRAERPGIRNTGGFTLLELVLALLLIALLSGMIFTTARSSLMLGNNIVRTQGDEMLHQSFFDFLENRFSSLPGNTRMQLMASDSGSHYLSDLTLQNVPMSFTWGGTERSAKAIRISTEKRASGYLDIVLTYYENEIIDPESAEGTASSIDELPFAEITLLTDVAYFEWRVLDGRTMEWQFDWDLPGRLPLQLELVCAFGPDGSEIRQIFWIPPRQNPETFMAQLAQQSGGGQSSPPEPEIPADQPPPPNGAPPGNGQQERQPNTPNQR
ncbi:MAG: prepilin-type N-terminal cleavage/methylation domain-containing protein [Luteolibacter sp.]